MSGWRKRGGGSMSWTPKIEKTFNKDGVIQSQTIQYLPNSEKQDLPPGWSFEPFKKEWQGLTDEEFEYCCSLKTPGAIAEEVEAKLRKKNA